mgnify:CR=1 FL=1
MRSKTAEEILKLIIIPKEYFGLADNSIVGIGNIIKINEKRMHTS